MRATLRHARISPKKANLVASMIRGMTVSDALGTLERLPKKGALFLRGLIASAVANAAHTANQKPEDLFVKTLIVNKGPAFRRFIPIARGRARPIDKATSHMTVELGVSVPGGEIRKEAEEAEGAKETTSKMAVEEGAPEGHVPEEGAKKPPAPTFDSSADPHAKGSERGRKGPTFQPYRRGGRGG